MPVDGKLHIACTECGWRIFATVEHAKEHGWMLWLGGSRCFTCVNEKRVAQPSDLCQCGHERCYHYGLRGACLSSTCKHGCQKFEPVRAAVAIAGGN